MDLCQLVPAWMVLKHEVTQTRIIKLLDLDFLTGSSQLLEMLEALTQRFIEVANLMVLSMSIFDRSSIEGPHVLNTSYGAFSRLGPTNLFSKYRVIQHSEVPKRGELVEIVEASPIVDQILFHRDHIQIIEARSVVDILDSVLVQSQSLQVRKVSKFDYFIPRLDTVSLQIYEFQKFKMDSWYFVKAANPVAIVTNKVQLFNVDQCRCEG